MKKNGIYVHFPFCLQQCPYCDFATAPNTDDSGKDAYISMVLQEITNRNPGVPFREVSTLYFGGGTPSLAGPGRIAAVIERLRNVGFDLSGLEEVTLEINPGTISQEDLNAYLKLGVSRFSLGIQSFRDALLRGIGREHSAVETRQTLGLLRNAGVNFTTDLLFALPNQSHEDLKLDLDDLLYFLPNHISAYCLTLPERHPLQKNRPDEEAQREMYYFVKEALTSAGYEHYEVSSYAKPGHRSRHNSLYWNQQSYWGIGMSAHSYFHTGDWGVRFWNPPTIPAYRAQVANNPLHENDIVQSLPLSQRDILKKNEAMTDYCHVRLRNLDGLHLGKLEQLLGPGERSLAESRLNRLQEKGLVEADGEIRRLSYEGLILSEQVFQEMTFLSSDL